MMPDLLDCPFCGSNDLSEAFNYVHCRSCFADGPQAPGTATARILWNAAMRRQVAILHSDTTAEEVAK